MSPPLLLVVPTLNSHLLLPRLVVSLRQQSFSGWRVLFVDGPSTAEHRAWLQELCVCDPRFRWQAQQANDTGIFGAMNQGFAAAQPEDWLLFWGSDDWAAAPDALEQAMAAADGDGDLLVCAGRYGGSGGRLGRASRFRRKADRLDGRRFRRALLCGHTPPHQATLFGPGARRLLAHYRESFRLAADLDYFLRLSTCPDLRVHQLDLELVHMGDGGVSGQRHQQRLAEVRQAYREAFGLGWPLPFLLRYLRRVLSLLDRAPSSNQNDNGD